jgi:hypothetical protein
LIDARHACRLAVSSGTSGAGITGRQLDDMFVVDGLSLRFSPRIALRIRQLARFFM